MMQVTNLTQEELSLGDWLKTVTRDHRAERIFELGRLTGWRHYEDTQIFGPANFERAVVLDEIIRRYQLAEILEIGTGRGLGCLSMAAAARAYSQSLRITTIDQIGPDVPQIWPICLEGKSLILKVSRQDIWAQHIPSSLSEGILCLTGKSTDILPRLVRENRRYDLIFIDAGHDPFSVMHDLVYAYDLLSDKGIILMDDFAPLDDFGWGTCLVSPLLKKIFIDVQVFHSDGIVFGSSSDVAFPRGMIFLKNKSGVCLNWNWPQRIWWKALSCTARLHYRIPLLKKPNRRSLNLMQSFKHEVMLLCPVALLRGIRSFIRFPAKIKFKKVLSNIKVTPDVNHAVVSYGDFRRYEKAGILQGGRVKLNILKKSFPEYYERMNILYLVSSALPAHAEELVAWAKKQGAKLVWNQNGVAYPSWAGKLTRFINDPMQKMRHQADYVIYQSEFCRRCADRYLGPHEGPFQIVYNAVDTNQFHPKSPVLDDHSWRLLCMGTHEKPYRILSVLEMLKKLREQGCPAHLTIAGLLRWSRAEKDIRRSVKSHDLESHVRIHGPYLQSEAPAIYQNAHILIHPKYKDPCPTVVIEALASGLPVVGSDSGGVPELVSFDTGIVVRVPDCWERDHAPDPDAMAQAVKAIMTTWKAYHEAARARAVSNFSHAKFIEKHKTIFETVRRA